MPTITIKRCGDCPYFDSRDGESMTRPHCTLAPYDQAHNWRVTNANDLPAWCPLLDRELAKRQWCDARDCATVTEDYGDLVRLICPCGEKLELTEEIICWRCGRVYRMYTTIEVKEPENHA